VLPLAVLLALLLVLRLAVVRQLRVRVRRPVRQRQQAVALSECHLVLVRFEVRP